MSGSFVFGFEQRVSAYVASIGYPPLKSSCYQFVHEVCSIKFISQFRSIMDRVVGHSLLTPCCACAARGQMIALGLGYFCKCMAIVCSLQAQYLGPIYLVFIALEAAPLANF